MFISLLLNKLLKKNCVDIKNINGNISKTNIGVFIKDKYSGNKELTLISLKNSNSVNKLSIKIRLKKIKKIFIKDER
tara:strand:- start:1227 stop:1457 length:231 start_codon:yes stop_codon:yes gene_type:complete